jgi:LPS-assembly protein
VRRDSLLFLIYSLFLLQSLFGEEDRLYFLSDKIAITEEGAMAYRDATVIFKDRYMRAEQIFYNEDKSYIELFGNVTLVESGSYFFVGDYAKVSTDGKKVSIDNMFLYNKERHVWLYSDEANATDDRYVLKDTFLSSCRSENPDWGFYVNKGYFYKSDEVFELYHVLLYASDVPVIYIPYMNFSIKRERKSGLLIPQFGFSAQEGFYLSQPFYIVPNDWSDFEFSPQIRTERGKGVYGKYRFVDSAVSNGEVTLGYFEESDTYFKRENLAHKEHYGLEFLYQSHSILESIDDGLYFNVRYLNDIDYLNLKPQYENGDSETTNLIESRLNYYISSGDHSFGIYNRYTIDTSKNSNEDTLQTLPHFQYHHDISPFLDNFLYSFDYNYKNFYREVGSQAVQHKVSVPLTFYTSFYDDYLKVRLSEHFYLSRIYFKYTENFKDDRNLYFRNYHQLELFSDLSKKYENSFHSTDFGLNLIVVDQEYKDGFYSPEESKSRNYDCEVDSVCEFQTEERVDSSLEIRFSQYLHEVSGEEIFYHRLSQPVDVSKENIGRWGLLTNEFKWFITPILSLYNSLKYSQYKSKLTEISSIIEYNSDNYAFDLSHFIKEDESTDELEFISSELSIRVDDKYSLFGHYSYDLVDNSTRSWGAGYEMRKRCWNYKLSYKQDYLPQLTKSGTSAQRNNIFYFLIELYPLGGFEYEFK